MYESKSESLKTKQKICKETNFFFKCKPLSLKANQKVWKYQNVWEEESLKAN